MNIQQYITSGILELYVLDRLEPAEMRAVEAMAEQYPEVRAELDEIELTLEGLAMAMAAEPDPKILDRLLLGVGQMPDTEKPVDKIPKVPAEKISRGVLGTVLPWVMVAAGLLGLLYFYNQSGQRANELSDLQDRYTVLKEECAESQEILQAQQEFIDNLTNPATQNIVLAGTDNAPEKSAIVFYNPATKSTLFRATNLPPPPSGKQYQLWAIDENGPRDLGVLATDISGDLILEVDYLNDVATFAVTLEDEGGKPTPDLTQLQVIGNVG